MGEGSAAAEASYGCMRGLFAEVTSARYGG